MTRTAVSPHANTRLIEYGAQKNHASAGMILLHGRGASPEDIISLGHEIDLDEVAYLAPAAANAAWYPNSFLFPRESNQPWLDSAMDRISEILSTFGATGISDEQVVLAGFSQGACLAAEYAMRNPRQFGGVLVFSGGLIGDQLHPDDYQGSLKGTPVYLGCSDIDPYIPLERVHQSAEVFKQRGAEVEVSIFPGMAHTIHPDELQAARRMLLGILDTNN